MKYTKTICLLLSLLFVTALTGCGSSNTASRQGGTTNQVADTLNAQIAAAEGEPEEPSASESSACVAYENDTEYDQVDYDLTQMSSDMVYSTVYNMMADPDSYVGKTVKMEGAFAVYTDQLTQETYYACLISDAAACCSQGLEFVWGDGSHAQSEYPSEGETVCVTGVYETYQEGEYLYCRLNQSAIEVVDGEAAA